MRLSKSLILSGAVVLIINILFIAGWNAKQLETNNIHLRGSGNVAPIAAQAAEMFMQENPDIVVTVSSTGTMRGIKSLIDATCNIGMASADYDEGVAKRAKDNDLTLVEHVIAHDALVPIVNPRNPVTGLTVEQLRQLYSGEINNWQQLGGGDEPVIILSHDGTSGNYETWKEKVMGEGKIVTPKAKVMVSGPMKTYVQQNPGVIAFLGLSYIDNTVKPLTVNGIEATAANVKNGSYPIVRDLKLYTTQHSPASIAKFIEYMLAPDKGQKFVEQAGVLPVN